MQLFDPEPADATFSVSDLGAAIGRAARQAFPDEIWVRGEIRDLRRPPSGHVYFTLVEPGPRDRPGGPVSASVSVMLSVKNKGSVNRVLTDAGGGVRMTDGAEVRIRGRLDWFAPQGRLQLLMTSVDPAYTLGQLAAQRAQLIERLTADGTLGRNGTVPLPLVPMRIGLVTSEGSDAERDVLHELELSGFGFTVSTFDARVQGIEAPASLASGIAAVGPHVDLLIVARGGGGATDLMAFDSERVARAIAACPVPVFTGIGHERDQSIADEAAFRRHKTPTAAAQAVVALVRDYLDAATRRWEGIARVSQRQLDRHTDRVRAIATMTARSAGTATRSQIVRLERSSRDLTVLATRQLARAESTAESHHDRLRVRAPRVVRDQSRQLDEVAARLRLLDPAVILARGWSITRGPDGSVIRHVQDVRAGDELVTTVADGTVASTVVDSHQYGEADG